MDFALPQSRTWSHFFVCGALLLALGVCARPVAVHAQEIYQSVDAQGHVVFSDRPGAPGAERRESADEFPSLPQILHFCWTNCFTLKLENGLYTRTDGTEETWTVESFSPTAFVLDRHDTPAAWNRFKADVTYAGQVAHDRLVNVTVDGWPTDGIQAAWGSALSTLPSSNAERDQLYGGSPSQAGEPTADESAGPEVTATEEPPPLPEEEQPPCDEDGTVWTPGYWAWNGTAYYWVRGVWVLPIGVGLLWTPGYWAFVHGMFVFHRGHWGRRVGYYGGVNYGHGYFGAGYSGGHWAGARFAYNTAVSNVNTRFVQNTYREAVPASVPSRVTTISVPREHVASPPPHFAPTPRPTQRVQQGGQRIQQAGPRVAAMPAMHVERSARNGAPTHATVAPHTLARTPWRGSSHPRPTAPAAP
jgi:hypothetical protein